MLREQLLITTPESTESLLDFRKHTLDDLRALIIDEIHLLDGTSRGDQLRLVLGRLRPYLKHKRGSDDPGLQTVALSATVPDPARTAAAYLGTEAEIVRIPGERELEARVLVTSGDEVARARQAMEAAADFGDVRKVLVFVNSRATGGHGHRAFPARTFLWGAGVRPPRQLVQDGARGHRRALQERPAGGLRGHHDPGSGHRHRRCRSGGVHGPAVQPFQLLAAHRAGLPAHAGENASSVRGPRPGRRVAVRGPDPASTAGAAHAFARWRRYADPCSFSRSLLTYGRWTGGGGPSTNS